MRFEKAVLISTKKGTGGYSPNVTNKIFWFAPQNCRVNYRAMDKLHADLDISGSVQASRINTSASNPVP